MANNKSLLDECMKIYQKCPMTVNDKKTTIRAIKLKQ